MCLSKKELALLCKRNLLIFHLYFTNTLLFTQSLGPKLCCLFGFFTFFFFFFPNSASNPSANPISLHNIPLIQLPHFPYCYLLSPSHHSLSQITAETAIKLVSSPALWLPILTHCSPHCSPGDILQESNISLSCS